MNKTTDEAARAGWLYYVGGFTQDEIARKLDVSRQRAQRLVARAMADNLIRVSLDHPIATLCELERTLAERYGLRLVRVAPDTGAPGNPVSVSAIAAEELGRVLVSPKPLTLAVGTGRSLRAMVEALPAIEAGAHKIVSLVGVLAPDGRASYFDVVFRLAARTHCAAYPLLTPVMAGNGAERALYEQLPTFSAVLERAQNADVAFVGIGQMDETAPLLEDGFLSRAEWQELRQLGAVGEITGAPFDERGQWLETDATQRMMRVDLRPGPDNLVICIGAGAAKCKPLVTALRHRLINALITDEPTARILLKAPAPQQNRMEP